MARDKISITKSLKNLGTTSQPSTAVQPLCLPLKSMSWQPKPYMQKAVQFLLEHAAGGLFLDPGLGKTSITLAAISILKKQKMLNGPVLILAPLRPCYLVWPAEIQKWANFHHLTYTILHGKTKEINLDSKTDLYIMNYEGLEWLLSAGRFAALKFKTLVVDESTKLKRTNTKRFKLLKPWLQHFDRRWILTGTPIPRNLMDLFGQAYIMDMGYALGRYITHFRAQYFYQTGFGGYEWILQPGAEQKIYTQIQPLVLRLAAEDYLKMPKVIETNIYVDLPPVAMQAYNKLEQELFLLLESGEEVVAPTAAAASMKCRQLANGAIFTFDNFNNRSWQEVHTVKIEALIDRLEESGNKPTLVAYEFEHDKERLLKALGKDAVVFGGGVSMKKSSEIEQEWNKGNIQVLLGHPLAIGHGLNLQTGGQRIIWFGTTFDYELYEQFNRRIVRQGTVHKSIFVDHLLARNTVDELKMLSLSTKKRGQNSLFTALKLYRQSKK